MRTSTLLLLVACTLNMYAQSISTEKITLKPYMVLQNYEHFKRLVQVSSDPELLYINGLDYEWGYEYVVSVKKTKLKETLSDGTRYGYALDKIISKTSVSDTVQFKMMIDPMRYYHESTDLEEMNRTLSLINDSTYGYFGRVEIEVPEYLRATFKEIANGKTFKRGVFGFTGNNKIRLLKILD
jgi:hypothetical protein